MEAGSRLAALSLLSVLLSRCVCAFSPDQIDPQLSDEQLLWVSSLEGEVNTYRIPLITFTPKGSLLAFSEGRKASRSDYGSKFIAMRRSTDKGNTWFPTTFIVNDGTKSDGLNLGSVVVDEKERLVILVYSECFHICQLSRTMMIKSWDDGISWSRPVDLHLNYSFAPGPGYGIQVRGNDTGEEVAELFVVKVMLVDADVKRRGLASPGRGVEIEMTPTLMHHPEEKRYPPAQGRLVVCGHGTLEGNGVFCILSDDHGSSWYNGAALKSMPFNQRKRAQDFNPDECQPFEMRDGSIVINVRNQNNYHCRCRIVVRSFDGGITLPVEHLYFDYELVDPAVAAGALQKDGVLYFTNPSHEQHRVNLTLRWSLNDGSSWVRKAVQIWAGPSGYSSMTSLDTGSTDDEKYIFVIYEKGHNNYDENIAFAKFHLFGGR